MANRIIVELDLDSSNFKRDLSRVRSVIGGTEKTTKKFSGSVAKMAKGFIAAQVVMGAFRVGMRALRSTIVGSVKSFADFDKGIRKVSTLLAGEGTEAIDTIRNELLELPAIMGSIQETTEAAYQAISAGIKPARAITFVAEAAKLARAGFLSVNDSVDALTTVINAYGLSLEETTRISDIFITTQNLGKTTVQELSLVIGRVIPLAAASGVKFEEVGAALATLTAAGIKTEEAVTGLRAIFTAVLKPSEEAAEAAERLGIDFSVAALQSKGLAGFIAEIKDKAGESATDLTALFGNVRALVPILSLAGENADKFSENLKSMTTAAGATEDAFKKVSEGPAAAFEVLGVVMEKVKIRFGAFIIQAKEVQVFLTAIIGALDRLSGIQEKSTKAFEDQSQALFDASEKSKEFIELEKKLTQAQMIQLQQQAIGNNAWLARTTLLDAVAMAQKDLNQQMQKDIKAFEGLSAQMNNNSIALADVVKTQEEFKFSVFDSVQALDAMQKNTTASAETLKKFAEEQGTTIETLEDLKNVIKEFNDEQKKIKAVKLIDAEKTAKEVALVAESLKKVKELTVQNEKDTKAALNEIIDADFERKAERDIAELERLIEFNEGKAEIQQEFRDRIDEIDKEAEIKRVERARETFEKQNVFLGKLTKAYGIETGKQVKFSITAFETIATSGVKAFQQIESALADATFQAIKGGTKIREVWQSLADNLLKTMIDTLIRIAAQFLITQLFSVVAAKKAGVAQVQKASVVGGINAAASAASTIVLLPLAPAIGAAFATLLLTRGLAGLAGIGSFQKGTDFVPQTGNALIHRGERIVDSGTNLDLKSFLAEERDSNRDSVTVNLNIENFIGTQEFADDITEQIRDSIVNRNNEFPGVVGA